MATKAKLQAHPLAGTMPRRRRTAEKRESIRDEQNRFVGMQRYCEIVTPTWHWEWAHLRLIDWYLAKVLRGEIKKIIFQMPPRHGKTEKITVRFPAAFLELDSSHRVIIAAYNDTLARKFSRKVRRIVRYRLPLSDERTAVEDWETASGGGLRAVGVGAGIAGHGGNLILVDDPVKNREEAESPTYREKVYDWYTDDLYTRLEPGAAMVITMTRWHEDDLVGRILASEDGPNWTVVSLPALAEPGDELRRPVGAALCPERYDEKALADIRVVQGERSFAALFQQQPSPAKGLIFDTEQFRFYTTPEHPIIENGRAVPYLPPVFSSHLQSWDMAFKDTEGADNVAGHFWSRLGADVYLRDRKHGVMEFTKTLTAVLALTKAHPEATLKLVEDKANGPAVISILRSKIPGLVAIEPEGSKISRAWAVTPMIEAGNVWLPHPAIAPWVKSVLLELSRFPFGKRDDDVDALTQALMRFLRQIREGMGEPSKPEETLSEAATVAAKRF
jgi:predicted phage terminase large subunit-like protein